MEDATKTTSLLNIMVQVGDPETIRLEPWGNGSFATLILGKNVILLNGTAEGYSKLISELTRMVGAKNDVIKTGHECQICGGQFEVSEASWIACTGCGFSDCLDDEIENRRETFAIYSASAEAKRLIEKADLEHVPHEPDVGIQGGTHGCVSLVSDANELFILAQLDQEQILTEDGGTVEDLQVTREGRNLEITFGVIYEDQEEAGW